MRRHLAIAILTLLAACSSSMVTDRESLDSDGTIEDPDKVSNPIQVSGGFLADFGNSGVKCTFQDIKTNPKVNTQINCDITVTLEGREILATRVDKDSNFAWFNPKVQFGLVKNISCVVSSDARNQSCELLAESKTARLEFGFKVSKEGDSKTKSATVLLPYSVEVAAGFVPSLSQYRSDLEVPAAKLSLTGDEAPIAHGFEAPTFTQEDVGVTPVRYCSASHGFYFMNNDRIIYRMKKGYFQRFMGSQFDLPEQRFDNPLRYHFKSLATTFISCTEKGLYVFNNNVVLFVDPKGVMSKLFDVPSQLSMNQGNFHAMTNGDIFYQLDLKLMKYVAATGQHEVYVEDFRSPTMQSGSDLTLKNVTGYFQTDEGIEYYQKYMLLKTGASQFYWIKKEGENLSLLFKKFEVLAGETIEPFKIAINDRMQENPIFTREGDIYYRRVGYYSANYANVLENDVRRIDRNGNITDLFNLDSPPYMGGMGANFTLMGLESENSVIAFEGQVKKLFAASSGSWQYIPVKPRLGSRDDKPASSTFVLPYMPMAGRKTNVFLNDYQFMRIEGGMLKPLLIMRSCRDVRYSGGISIAEAPNGDIYYTCNGVMYKYDGVVNSIVGNPKGTKFDGPVADVRINSASKMYFDKDGTLNWLEGNSIKTLKDGIVSRIVLNFTPNSYHMVSADEFVWVDQMMNRIKRAKRNGDTWDSEVIAGVTPMDEWGAPREGKILGDGDLAVKAELAWPTQLAVSSDGVMYVIDGNNIPMNASEGRAIRVIHPEIRNGKSELVINNFFGGANTSECGSGKVGGSAELTSITDKIKSSIDVICKGMITGISVIDNCEDDNGQVKILITQRLGADNGNVVEVVRPCLQKVTKK